MLMRDYKTAALRTASTEFHGEVQHREGVERLFSAIIGLNQTLDAVKKGLFYGKKNPDLEAGTGTDWDGIDKDLLHAGLGLVTEGVEFLEKVFQGADRAALVSELGDTMWYANIATRPLKTDLGKVAKLNIDKLAKRYPDKFSLDAAVSKSVEDEDAMIADQLGGSRFVIQASTGEYFGGKFGGHTWVTEVELATNFYDRESAEGLGKVLFPGHDWKVVEKTL